MATFDISRRAFNPGKHYSSVRMQQGRVLTDDDWNENERIEEEIFRRTQVDIIGRSGSPDDGFKIDPASFTTAGGFIDFDILAGTIYTGGLRLEMDNIEKFLLQKDWLGLKKDDYKIPAVADFFNGNTQLFDLVYLEAWQQPVSAVEDSSLFEAALGGPDTTTRLRNMRRIKIFKNTESDECPVSWKKLKDDWATQHFGTINKEDELIPVTNLKVSFINSGDTDDLCSPSVAGGYLGAENQAIRVQVTNYDAATNSGHFTWGFDNAAPFYRITTSADANGNTLVTMITEPKDQYHWPLAGQVIEILPWSAVLPNNEKIAEQTGFLSKVAVSYNPDNKSFILNTPLPANFGAEWKGRSDEPALKLPAEFLFMRVWNRGSDSNSLKEISFTQGTPVTLGNTGLQVTFTGNDFIAPNGTGNFWVIAARPSTPQSVVPWELTTTGVSPHGVRFFYSPLAIIRWTNVGGVVQGAIIHDCRKHFRPLTEQECCCTYTVGDGIRSKGDFNSIQEAVNNLPPQGGKVCVLAGIHNANVIIEKLRQVHIIGCGDQTIVRSMENRSVEPLFRVQHSQRVKFENMTLVSVDGTAIEVEDLSLQDEPSEEITIRDNRILAFKHAVFVNLQDRAGDNNIKIVYNLIGMFDKPLGDVAIFTLADDVLIERNRIVLIPDPSTNDPQDPNDPPGDVTDPCADIKKIYEKDYRFREMVHKYVRYVNATVFTGAGVVYRASGGIQVGCSSEKIWILENEIIGGKGAGILLGHLPVPPPGEEVFDVHFAPISQILIDGNTIQQMGIAGIAPYTQSNDQVASSDILTKDISIYRNKIFFCALQIPPERLLDSIAYGGIILSFCEEGMIQENRIEDNGKSHLEPVCGIFILHGEKVDISNNRVLNNGPHTAAPDNKATAGFRGGIIIRMAYKSLDIPAKDDRTRNANEIITEKPGVPTFDAVPAVKIHDNIVTQPLGQALFLMAFGPVSVVSNQFTSQGIYRPDKYALLAGSVFIMNLGVSKDLINIVMAQFGKIKSLPYNNPSTLLALAVNPASAMGRLLRMYQLLPSGRTMFTANQTTLDLRSTDRSIAISSQLILSLDDISFVNNQSECAALVSGISKPQGYTADMVLLNTLLAGVSIRSNDNRFTDGFSLTLLSLFSLGFVNTCTDNQATHCLLAIGPPDFLFDAHNIVIIPNFCNEKTRKLGVQFGKRTNVRTARG